MEVYHVEATDETPEVYLDPEKGEFQFSGKSLPEDVRSFYDPILQWIEQYNQDPKPQTDVVFKMIYFNTASSKLLMDIMLKLEEIHDAEGSEVTVHWYYQEDDEDMEEAGEEYEEIVEIPFERKILEVNG